MFRNVNPHLDSMDGDPPAIPLGMDTPGKRVQWALKQRGKKPTELSKYLGISRGAVSQWWQEISPTSPERHYEKIVQFLGCNFEWLRNGTGPVFPDAATQLNPRHPLAFASGSSHNEVFTLGEVAAGMFLSVSEINDLNYEREPSAFPPLPDYPLDKQYDLVVRGNSINRFAKDGERVRCVSIHSGIDLRPGDYVHVERYRHQRSEIENTIKQAFLVGGKWELRFDSSDPRWEDQPPLVLGSGPNDQVEIVGIALFQFFPSPSRRRSSK